MEVGIDHGGNIFITFLVEGHLSNKCFQSQPTCILYSAQCALIFRTVRTNYIFIIYRKTEILFDLKFRSQINLSDFFNVTLCSLYIVFLKALRTISIKHS